MTAPLNPTKSMSYDHPAYTSISSKDCAQITAGANAVSTKFIAFTAKLIKSAVVRITTVAGTTNANNLALVQITGSGTATVTNTYTMGTLTATGTGGTNSLNAAEAQGAPIAINQGDQYWLQNGADTTVVWQGVLEEVIQPLANVSAP